MARLRFEAIRCPCGLEVRLAVFGDCAVGGVDTKVSGKLCTRETRVGSAMDCDRFRTAVKTQTWTAQTAEPPFSG